MPAGLAPETTRLPRCDFVLRGGTVIDGTQGAALRRRRRHRGGRIAAVGDARGARRRRTIDAAGHIVAPGFIDSHTHDDQALLTAAGHGLSRSRRA